MRRLRTSGATVPLPIPNSIYAIGRILNQDSSAGSLSLGGGPGGGFGGTLGTGSTLTILLGVSPLPNIFGSLILPLNAGSTATVTAMADILGNAVTVAVSGLGWTTRTITYNDGNFGTTTGGITMALVLNPFVTSGTAMGTNNLGSAPNGGGTITLVAPITIKVLGATNDLRAGYQVLSFSFIPSPAASYCWAPALRPFLSGLGGTLPFDLQDSLAGEHIRGA